MPRFKLFGKSKKKKVATQQVVTPPPPTHAPPTAPFPVPTRWQGARPNGQVQQPPQLGNRPPKAPPTWVGARPNGQVQQPPQLGNRPPKAPPTWVGARPNGQAQQLVPLGSRPPKSPPPPTPEVVPEPPVTNDYATTHHDLGFKLSDYDYGSIPTTHVPLPSQVQKPPVTDDYATTHHDLGFKLSDYDYGSIPTTHLPLPRTGTTPTKPPVTEDYATTHHDPGFQVSDYDYGSIPPTHVPVPQNAYSRNAYSTNAYSTNAYSTNAYSTNAYSTNAYSVTSFDEHVGDDVTDDAANDMADEVDALVEDPTTDTAPDVAPKPVKQRPPLDTPAVRKHRAWLVAQLDEEYKEERTTQRKHLADAVRDLAVEVARAYVAIQLLAGSADDDYAALLSAKSAFASDHPVWQLYAVRSAQSYLVDVHADLLEKARREELPITEKGEVGDLSARMVEYDDEAAQQKSLVLVGGGKLHRNDTERTPVDTKGGVTHFSGNGAEIFVVSTDGEIHMASHKLGKYHHSSLLGGKPVGMAGELKVTQGRIDWISCKSGHYKPTVLQLQQFLHHLRKDGVDLHFEVQGLNIPPKTTARAVVDGVSYEGKAKKKLGLAHRKGERLLEAWVTTVGKVSLEATLRKKGWWLEDNDPDPDDDEDLVYWVEDSDQKRVDLAQVNTYLKGAYPGVRPQARK